MILTVDDYDGFTEVSQKIEGLAYDLIEGCEMLFRK